MEENKFISFLFKYRSKVIFAMLVLTCAAVWYGRLSGKREGQSKHDYIVIHQMFEQFQKAGKIPVESLEVAEEILQRHPELHPKYDSLLALSFFAEHMAEKGARYAASLFERANPLLPSFYKEFAETSLLIAKGKYEEALAAATVLEHKLTEEKYLSLEAMNLLRIFFLSDVLNDGANMKSYAQKIEKHPAYLTLQEIFQEGKLTLQDYLNK
jgi:hypothetical protein